MSIRLPLPQKAMFVACVKGDVDALRLLLDQTAVVDAASSEADEKEASDPAQSPPADDREAICRLFSRCAPEKLGNVDAILHKFEGQRERMYALLSTMFPGETIERPHHPPANDREALVRFYTRAHPDGLSSVDAILAKFESNRAEMYQVLGKLFPGQTIERPSH